MTINPTAGHHDARDDDPRARRIAQLSAGDPQFQAAQPIPEVIAAARRPGMRLAPILQTLVEGYPDRPALGWRARELVTDPVTGRTSERLAPRFDTLSYRQLWARVVAVAAAWRHHPQHPLNPGDFVATIGFGSADYLTVDVACAYLGLVAVPLAHTAPVSELAPILAEIQPRVIAVSAAYLDLAVAAASGSASLRNLLVFDYRPELDEHRETLVRARRLVHDAAVPIVIETLDEVANRGHALPPEPVYTADSDERLAMIIYTSGSTGTPKGAMQTERMVAKVWTSSFASLSQTPVFNVNFMPLNHLGGRLPLVSAFLAGGTSYFTAEADLSTLFEDWSLVRPTELALVPRVVEMLYQRHRGAVSRLGSEDAAEEAADTELREQLLGGRVIDGFVGTAPLATAMKSFLERCLQTHISDGYGSSEVGAITRDAVVMRPPVIDYKLVDVPDLGYFSTDKPYPRGELLIKTATATPGYYRRPEATAAAFDNHGYYRTGDVVAEISPDRVVYVDRAKNVLKLSQGEFVAVANLEAVFTGAALVRQVFVYGNSERPRLLAVIVPTPDALAEFGDDTAALKAAVSRSLRDTARAAELQSYQVPVDFIVEPDPFTVANGLLADVGKVLRPKLTAHYGPRLEQLYTDLAGAQDDRLDGLRRAAPDQPVLDSLRQAAAAVLGSADVEADPDVQFTDLGGDSLSALTLSTLLRDVFDVDVPVGVIVGPTATLRELADYVVAQRDSESKRPTSAGVHGRGATELHARDLTLDKFIDAVTLADAATAPHPGGEPRTVLLTGANGYLGRFVALHWLQRLSRTGGTLICLVRGRDADTARARLEQIFDSGDATLRRRFHELAADHLEVLAGDIGEPDLGLDTEDWRRLSRSVDLIVHTAALVNHVLPYEQLFGPNVVGTAELIRLAITSRITPIAYLSTVSVALSVEPAAFTEDGDIREISPVRSVDDSYANGYANSKWAGEVLLREAFDLVGLPATVFRSDLILAHSRYRGQLNVPDMFTRLIVSLLATGIAPGSFYETDPAGNRQRAHYAGLPVDFVADAVSTLGAQNTAEFRSFDVMNPHDDGVSLDTFVDWLREAGQPLVRIDDYEEWLARFETALRALPETRRQHTVLPLLDAYRKPQQPLRGAPAPTEMFRNAVRDAKIGAAQDIPQLSMALIDKYLADLAQLGLLPTNEGVRA
ncbi:MAG: carboxylic acid reductase [Mycobacterium sp.]